MTVSLAITNASLVLPDGIISGGVAVDDGKIVSVSKEPNLPPASRTIDARGMYLIPGAVDPHVHWGTKYPLDEDFRNESPGAAAGGVTTVGDMLGSPGAFLPHKDFPDCSDVKSWHEALPSFKRIAESNSYVDFYVSPQIQSELEVREIREYASTEGITSFKFYAHMKRADLTDVSPRWKSRLGLPCDYDDGLIYRAFQEIANLGPPAILMIHCENSEITSRLMKLLQSQGRRDPMAWAERSSGIPEAEHVMSYSYLAKVTDSRLYVVHLSSKLGLHQCSEAIKGGVNITVETCPQYLIKTKRDVEGPLLKVNPPIQDTEDNAALWEGLRDGTINCIGTDHVVQTKNAKLVAGDVGDREDPMHNIWEVGSGFPGVETVLPIMLSEGVNKGRITFERLVQVCCRNTSKTFGLYPKKGALIAGGDADLVLIDMKKTKKVRAEQLHTRADFSIYEGLELTGWPVLTILRGEVIARDGEILGKQGVGRYQPRTVEAHQRASSADSNAA